MKNIDVIRELVLSMGDLTPKNEAIRIGIIAVLDKLTQANTQKTAVKKAEPKEPEAKPSKRGRKRKFDLGKAKACYDLGWPLKKIAEELGCTEQTVRNNLAKAEE